MLTERQSISLKPGCLHNGLIFSGPDKAVYPLQPENLIKAIGLLGAEVLEGHSLLKHTY